MERTRCLLIDFNEKLLMTNSLRVTIDRIELIHLVQLIINLIDSNTKLIKNAKSEGRN